MSEKTPRQQWMATLARASRAEIEALAGELPAHEVLKAPETGTVMVEGRAGGAGRRFNLGEATVTRCVVRLGDGAMGFSYALGRDARKARLAAILDARLQGESEDGAAASRHRRSCRAAGGGAQARLAQGRGHQGRFLHPRQGRVMQQTPSLIGPGFADPIFQSQAAFRALLAALSEPGTVQAVGSGSAAARRARSPPPRSPC